MPLLNFFRKPENTRFKFVSVERNDDTAFTLRLNDRAEYPTMIGVLNKLPNLAALRDTQLSSTFRCEGNLEKTNITVTGTEQDLRNLISVLANNLYALSGNCIDKCQELGLLESTSKLSHIPQQPVACN